MGSSSVASPRNVLPPSAAPGVRDLHRLCLATFLYPCLGGPGCTIAAFTAGTQEMVGQRTALLFISRQTSLKGCVVYEETFITEKA